MDESDENRFQGLGADSLLLAIGECFREMRIKNAIRDGKLFKSLKKKMLKAKRRRDWECRRMAREERDSEFERFCEQADARSKRRQEEWARMGGPPKLPGLQ